VARVLVAGESWITTSTHVKGFDSFTTAEYMEGVADFRGALEGRGHEVIHQPCHVAANDFPWDVDGLSEYDVVVLSDIGSNTLLLPPVVFRDAEERPNRLAALREWIRGGGGFVMAGGYLSFQGFEGKANYGNTPLAEALPVELDSGDDRRELPEDTRPNVRAPENPLVAGMEARWPPILGYQHVSPRADAEVLVTIGGDPLVVCGSFGKGRTLAFTSDIGPHWVSPSFVAWDGYAEFWDRAVRWLADGRSVTPGSEEAAVHVR
jgi:uncharacterized membrane protein